MADMATIVAPEAVRAVLRAGTPCIVAPGYRAICLGHGIEHDGVLVYDRHRKTERLVPVTDVSACLRDPTAIAHVGWAVWQRLAGWLEHATEGMDAEDASETKAEVTRVLEAATGVGALDMGPHDRETLRSVAEHVLTWESANV
jgi:hypothetical protein